MGRRRKTLEGEVVEAFYGVYLLVCANPKFKGRTYIGFTVDPNRRIQQHNLGKEKGGAWRTSNRGPWDMVLIIHGFPNDISALRFEWAWQHPERSRRLRHVSKKKQKESAFNFAVRVLSEMLCVGPWCRLPLVIRWLIPDRAVLFPAETVAPFHMALCYGPVVSKNLPGHEKKVSGSDDGSANEDPVIICCLCAEPCSSDKLISCIKPSCSLLAHIICLANHFLTKEDGHIIPVDGVCPECETTVLWGDLIRKRKGCYANLTEEQETHNLSDYGINL